MIHPGIHGKDKPLAFLRQLIIDKIEMAIGITIAIVQQ